MTGIVSVSSDLDGFAAAVGDAAADLPAMVAGADSAVSELVGRASLSTVPVASGLLLRSGVFGGGHIVFTASHAVAVFGGTPAMPARPWVLDAWDNQTPAILEAYEAAVLEALGPVT